MNKEITPPPPPEKHQSRWQLGRDLLVFQAKLIMDGLRDVILSPVSIIAGLFGMITEPENPHKYFHKVLKWGGRSEKWINLFGRWGQNESTVDELFAKLEQKIVSDYQEGGVTASAKNVMDRSLDALDDQVKELRKQLKPRVIDDTGTSKNPGLPEK